MNPGCSMSLGELKTWNKDLIHQLREEAINNGFTFRGYVYDSDARARANITGVSTLAISLIATSQPLPAGFTWRTMDNLNISFTSPLDIVALGMQMFSHLTTCYEVSWMHKEAIDNMQDIASLIAYDCSTLWPHQ